MGASHSAVETALTSVIDLFGPSLLYQADYLKDFLEEECPDAAGEIPVLLIALNKQVPQDLLGAHTDEALEVLLPRLAKRLCDQKVLTLEASSWAVRTWARAHGLASTPAGALPESLYIDDDAIMAPANASNEIAGSRPETELSAPNRWVAMAAVLLTVIVAGIAIWFVSHPHAPTITQVASSEALIGDGKARGVFVSFTSNGIAVRGIQITFVRGDGEWSGEPVLVDVSPEAAAAGRVPAGSIALHTTKPATATFEYVLMSDSGKGSAPFEKTFEIAAGPAAPAAPAAIVAGEPERVELDAVSPPARVAHVATEGCTLTTCGRVVAVREIDRKPDDTDFKATLARAFGGSAGRQNLRAQKTYAVTIRMDDGKTRVISQAASWRNGARVRVTGSTISALDS